MQWLTLSGSNYPCLERISMVPKMFEPLRFDCIVIFFILFIYLFIIIFFFFSGFTAQSTKCGHVQRIKFIYLHIYRASLVL